MGDERWRCDDSEALYNARLPDRHGELAAKQTTLGTPAPSPDQMDFRIFFVPSFFGLACDCSLTTAVMTEQHVPAWKRLGLSLTNAKDTAPPPASPATSTKRSRDDADTPKGSKKQRLENGVNTSSPAPKQLQPSSVASISSPMPSKLYAISFCSRSNKSPDSMKPVFVMNCALTKLAPLFISQMLTLFSDERRLKNPS